MKNNLPLGRLGEDLAAKHLKSKGFKILQRNFQNRTGEIDLIAQENDTLVFVEVKTRFSEKYGAVEEAITPWKLKSVVKTAEFYKSLHPELPEGMRIDAVLIQLSPAGEVQRLNHIKNISG